MQSSPAATSHQTVAIEWRHDTGVKEWDATHHWFNSFIARDFDQFELVALAEKLVESKRASYEYWDTVARLHSQRQQAAEDEGRHEAYIAEQRAKPGGWEGDTGLKEMKIWQALTQEQQHKANLGLPPLDETDRDCALRARFDGLRALSKVLQQAVVEDIELPPGAIVEGQMALTKSQKKKMMRREKFRIAQTGVPGPSQES